MWLSKQMVRLVNFFSYGFGRTGLVYQHPAMSPMNISLPQSLEALVDDQVSQRGYETSEAYVRDLIRKEQERSHLREMLLAGAASAPAVRADDAYLNNLRTRVHKASVSR